VSLLSFVNSESLQGKRIVLFSYGSGLAASMFSVRVSGPVDHIVSKLNIPNRLAARQKVTPETFDQTMQLREKTHHVKEYTPIGSLSDENLFPGTFYLDHVDDKYRRSYKRFMPAEAN
jgi:hydroxymethylglutaryl-CoA synthase